MALTEIEDAQTLADTIANTEYVILDVYASWCGPCKMVTPIMDRLNEEYEDILIAKVDIDSNEEFKQFTTQNNIRGIPTVIAYKRGEEVDRKTGLGSAGQYQLMFEGLLK